MHFLQIVTTNHFHYQKIKVLLKTLKTKIPFKKKRFVTPNKVDIEKPNPLIIFFNKLCFHISSLLKIIIHFLKFLGKIENFKNSPIHVLTTSYLELMSKHHGNF